MPLENKEWYDQAELANAWNVPVARVRMNVASLEAIKAIETREKPGDRRIKQVHRSSLDKLRIAVLGA
jgi:DNA-binding MarR family transcriptional regulator